MNALLLFFVTLLFFIAILLPIDRYSYPLRIGRSLFLCVLFYPLVGLMANPPLAGFIGYALVRGIEWARNYNHGDDWRTGPAEPAMTGGDLFSINSLNANTSASTRSGE